MRGKIVIAGAFVLGLVVVGAWQLGLLTPAPEEVSLASAVEAETGDNDQGAATDTTASEQSSTTEPSEVSNPDSTAPESAEAPCVFVRPDPVGDDRGEAVADEGELAGSWVIAESESSFAGYRIDEILSGQDFTAVGRTAGVSGTVVIEGSNPGAKIVAADVAVDMVGLSSDSRIRDTQMKSQALETNKFPTGCFTLTEPITVDSVPVGDESFTADASGTLHLHGVDEPVTITVQSTTSDGLLFVVGSTEVALADFSIDKPTAPSVADVSDTAVLEFSLVLTRQP